MILNRINLVPDIIKSLNNDNDKRISITKLSYLVDVMKILFDFHIKCLFYNLSNIKD